MSSPKPTARRTGRSDSDESALPFDVTQEIDPAFVDRALRSNDPTLTQGDFDDLTVELPKAPPPRR